MLYDDPTALLDDDDITYNNETRRQQAFNQGRNWLYKNPHFSLIHVEKHNDDTVTMTMMNVTTTDTTRRQQLQEQGYYCLSHLWGRDARDYMWDDSGILTEKANLNDDDGGGAVLAPAVPMRIEKRATLLALLKQNPGFWWIDVFCARVDTPLRIMGSIYKYCTACFAMMDCTFQTLRQLDQGLPSLMQEVSTHFPTKKRSSHRLPIMIGYIDEEEEVDEDKALLFKTILDKYPTEVQALLDLTESAWFTRVWTLQEAVLPRQLFMVPETQPSRELDTLDFSLVQKVSERLTTVGNAIMKGTSSKILNNIMEGTSSKILTDQHAHLIQQLETHVQEITVAQETYKQADALDEHDRLPCLQSTLHKFAESTRTCTDPVDFVYGVIGLLDIGLPRMDNAHQVWEAFQGKFRDMRVKQLDLHFYSVCKSAPFDLSQAKTMRTVYSSFIREMNL
ncbi:hypothetical protein K492DRAFT_176594 [Lichtheimia hyalospora FSU 10163]|nr:hypothetical protein K492DRAFT_176594 [Lichtheimia hyalospora FSU 10163]